MLCCVVYAGDPTPLVVDLTQYSPDQHILQINTTAPNGQMLVQNLPFNGAQGVYCYGCLCNVDTLLVWFKFVHAELVCSMILYLQCKMTEWVQKTDHLG